MQQPTSTHTIRTKSFDVNAMQSLTCGVHLPVDCPLYILRIVFIAYFPMLLDQTTQPCNSGINAVKQERNNAHKRQEHWNLNRRHRHRAASWASGHSTPPRGWVSGQQPSSRPPGAAEQQQPVLKSSSRCYLAGRLRHMQQQNPA